MGEKDNALKEKIKVLIVDDSASVRQAMAEILAGDPDIEVVGTANDPFAAVNRLKTVIPDVITLDVEMPRMDGLTFLQKIMSQHPIPVVMCSSLAENGSDIALRALEYGAVDIITKPKLGTRQFLEESRVRICDAVKAASQARLQPMITPTLKVAPKLTADVVLPKQSSVHQRLIQTTEKVVVVGASTGGTEALRVFLEAFPADSPGIVIVQHMPEHFTSTFAERLDRLCSLVVKEAEHNDTVVRGRALIAPGNRHLLLKRSGTRYYVEIKDGPLVARHRPSVDVLFRSAARYGGKNCIGIIMTGMGDDGAQGLLEMKEAGAFTLAQDEATSVVYGMPKEAVARGAVAKIVPLPHLAMEVLKLD